MTDKPIREQSALELLETHAKALEEENARLRAERDANIAAWERVLGMRSEGQATEWLEALMFLARSYKAALEDICQRGRNPIAEQALEFGEKSTATLALHAEARRVAVETPEKLWYIECNKCGRQDNPGYGCNALQPDGSRCNGTMRRTRLLFESNFGTPPDPRGAVETDAVHRALDVPPGEKVILGRLGHAEWCRHVFTDGGSSCNCGAAEKATGEQP